MAIAFYCEDEDPKVFHSSQGYYAAYGYNYYQQQQQSQHAAAVEQHQQQSQPAGGVGVSSTNVDENNNSNNCAWHGVDGGSSSGVSEGVTTINSNRQLMRVLHQVLYRYTMEGALSPTHTSCVFCNKIYYLFQLLY